MASNLERVGVILVAEGIGSFLGLMADAGKAVVGFLGNSINLAGDFEQTMNKLGAVSGATAEEIGLISDKAKALGADLTLPATSAVDAGNAMLELSKAGFTVTQTMDAAKGVLQLAAAAQIEEAKAAEIAANAINAFKLSAEDSVFVADLLANAANASSVEITDVAQSFQMAGSVFSTFQGRLADGKTALTDLTTAIAMLGNVGIKGSDAGTALKQSLLMLTGPSMKAKDAMRALFLATQAEGDAGQNLNKVLQGNAGERAKGLAGLQESAGATAALGDIAYDASGNMRSFREILDLTAKATAGMTMEMRDNAITTIFGADAIKVIAPLLDAGPEAWDKMTAAVTRQGAAQDLAAAQTKGYKGALEGAKSQLETLQLTIGEKFLPLLATLLSQYISPGIAQLTLFAEALFGNKEAVDQLNPTLAAALRWLDGARAAWGYWEKGIISTRTALDTLIPGLGEVAPVVEGIISAFNKGGAGAQLLGTYVDSLKERWAVLLPAITTVAEGVWAVVSRVFGAVQTFMERHGDEVLSFVMTTWTAINSIINDVMQIVALIVGDKLQKVANYFDTYGAEIQTVMTVAWNIISGVITTALNLIQGIVRATLQALQGDWSGAWTTIQNMSARFVATINNAIQGLLETIARAFGTSLAEIRATWSNNWDMLVSIVTKVVDRVRDVGSKIVNAIKGGFESAWSDFVKAAQGKLAEFRAMFPFSEPKDPSSPLYGLSKSGEAIVNNLAKGVTSNTMALLSAARTLGAQMIAQFGDDGKKAADALTSGMRDALDFRASIPRALDSIDSFLTGVGERLRTTGMYGGFTEDVQRQVQQALGQAQTLDPKAAAQFFKLRTDQIKEMTALQEQLFTATDAERGGLATRLSRIFEAQKLELQSFLSQIEGGGGVVSPPATLAQLLTGSNTVTNYGPQINYSPSYASGPQSPMYDYGVLQALTP